jgi:predicted glycosyltransferase
MRIWFDLSNSPHINLFRGLIDELTARHDVLITCRPLANTIELLELHRLPYTVVGAHYGKRLLPKLYGFPIRVAALRSFLAGKDVDVAVSQSSFHSPLVARLIGARSVYTNDNEHALGNIPSFVFANAILLPEYLNPGRVRWQGARRRKILTYPGVKEGIYLWQLAPQIRASRGRAAARSRPIVYVRPEPRTAQYYSGGEHFMDTMLIGLKDRARVVVLPRDAAQAGYYAGRDFEGIEVLTGVAELTTIAAECDLFIGAGGTMTREMAVLGIPTVSVYRGELLDVDRYLIGAGRMSHQPDLTAEQASAILERDDRVGGGEELLAKGRAAYELFRSVILGEAPGRGGLGE